MVRRMTDLRWERLPSSNEGVATVFLSLPNRPDKVQQRTIETVREQQEKLLMKTRDLIREVKEVPGQETLLYVTLEIPSGRDGVIVNPLAPVGETIIHVARDPKKSDGGSVTIQLVTARFTPQPGQPDHNIYAVASRKSEDITGVLGVFTGPAENPDVLQLAQTSYGGVTQTAYQRLTPFPAAAEPTASTRNT